MTTTYSLSSKICGNGKPRKSPRKRYVYLSCPKSKIVARVEAPKCQNRQKVRADILSRQLIDDLARLVVLSDDALVGALRIERQTPVDVNALANERRTLARSAKLASDVRHALTRQLVAGVLTDGEYQAEIFRFRADVTECDRRMMAIDESERLANIRPNFEQARKTVEWLSEKWTAMHVCERAEALRLLLRRITYHRDAPALAIRVDISEPGSIFSHGTFLQSSPLSSDAVAT